MSSTTVSCAVAYGSGWLGQVPNSWSTVPGRRLFAQRREQATSDDEQLTASQRYGVVPQSFFMQKEDQKVMLALNGTSNFRHVEPNDFVISLRSFEGGIEHSAYRGCVSPAYTVLRARGLIEPSFYRYLFKSAPYIAALQSTTDSLRDGKSITYDHFGAIYLPVPPLREQATIATFLDRETGKIDALVKEQKRLIELLKEKRQAVISHAVTKGLNPNVRMKPSGVEWLGDVPEHWDVTQLKYHVEITSGYAFPSEQFSLDPTDTRLLRGVNVGVGRVRWEDVVYWKRMPNDGLDYFELTEGDIVLGMDRPWIADGLRIARVSETDLPALLLQRVVSLRPKNGILPEHLMRLLQANAFLHHCVPDMTGVSVPHISPTQVGSFQVAVPSVTEQRAISEFLKEEIGRIDKLLLTAEDGVRLLEERRSALISAAVTGKLDVRNFNAQEEAA